MIDLRVLDKTQIYHDFDEVENDYWFSFKKSKFLHNIDTFYYSVKFKQDFTFDSSDKYVKEFRRFFETIYAQMEEANLYGSSMTFFLDGFETQLNVKPFNYAGYYNICLECPDYFDVFFAPKVPHSTDEEGNLTDSTTCQCVVQIRSYMLWMYGVKLSYERSYEYIKTIAAHFHLDIEFTQENRVDYCWHSNYLQNPAKFFNPTDFYRMRVDRFKDALIHTSKQGSQDYEIDYLAIGKRSDKIFIRIYLKSKEVIEKGYKPWFFMVWLFNGLINRFDLYCYEYAYVKHSWKALDMGRIRYYSEYGRDKDSIDKCNKILSGDLELDADELRSFADQITPSVNLVMNVEYQTMRKHSKSYQLIPFFDNTDKLTSKRIYDYLDNRKLICDYLTSKVFRLVEPYEPGVNDSNKSRRECCAFWKALRMCKLTDCFIPDEDKQLVRDYTSQKNGEILKSRTIKQAVTLGIYTKGINDSSPLQDCIEALCMMNDNDMEDAIRYKKKKVRQFNPIELAELSSKTVERPKNLMVIDKESGDIIF